MTMRPRGVALSSEMSKNTKGLACVGGGRGAQCTVQFAGAWRLLLLCPVVHAITPQVVGSWEPLLLLVLLRLVHQHKQQCAVWLLTNPKINAEKLVIFNDMFIPTLSKLQCPPHDS